MAKKVMLICHPDRSDVAEVAEELATLCEEQGITLFDGPGGAEGETVEEPELILVLGGDGTILSGARQAWKYDVPLLGINFGHLGFLAENYESTVKSIVERISADSYAIDSRMTLDVEVESLDGKIVRDWALNEAVVLRVDVAHPADLVFAVDGQAVSTYGADGIILATPTGSTAYSFSAGGPVVWPDVEAIVMAPLAAHGLFTRPLVVGPGSILEVGVLSQNWTAPQVWLDGIVAIDAPSGSTVRVTKGSKPLRFARLENMHFSQRLVTKFSLPASGWRS